MKVDLGAGGRVAETLPVGRNSIPLVLHTDIVPRWWTGCREASEGSDSEDRENQTPVVAHDHRISGAANETRGHWSLVSTGEL